MRNMLKIELRKAFGNKFFFLAICLACCIALLAAVYNVERYQREAEYTERASAISGERMNPYAPAFTLYNSWLCTDYVSFAASLFWFLSPIFATLAYGWSMSMEIKSGYRRNVMLRISRKNYYLSKLAAVFLAGGTVVTIPVVLNVAVTAMFIPAVKPDYFYKIYYPVGLPSMFSRLFYVCPLLHVIARILVAFTFAGAIATASFSMAFVICNRFAVVLLPFLLVLGVTYLQYLIPNEIHYAEFSPIYLMGAGGFNYSFLWGVLLEIGILLGVGLLAALGRGNRRDVF